jgi:hypothetical protein
VRLEWDENIIFVLHYTFNFFSHGNSFSFFIIIHNNSQNRLWRHLPRQNGYHRTHIFDLFANIRLGLLLWAPFEPGVVLAKASAGRHRRLGFLHLGVGRFHVDGLGRLFIFRCGSSLCHYGYVCALILYCCDIVFFVCLWGKYGL